MSERTKRFVLYIVLFLLAGLITVGLIWIFTNAKDNGGTGTIDEDGFNLFPRGNVNPDNNASGDFSGTSGKGPTRKLPRLRILSGEPVAGYFPYQIPDESTLVGTTTAETFEPAVVYAQRATGHIFMTKMSEEGQTRTSNTTVPKVYDALFSSSTIALYRYLFDDGETIRTFSGSISNSTTTSTSTFQGTFLPNNIESIALSPTGKEVVYGYENGDTFSLTRSLMSGASATTIFNSFVKEWNLQWPTANAVFLTTKADSRYPGILYRLDPVTKRFDKLISDVSGLTTLVNTDGRLAFISYSDAALGMRSAIYDIAARTYTFPQFNTYVEKCVWSKIDPSLAYCAVPLDVPNEAQPEGWYKSTTQTRDVIYKVDATTGETSLVLDEKELGENEIDMEKLALSPDEDYIYFINKKDLTLWSYEL